MPRPSLVIPTMKGRAELPNLDFPGGRGYLEKILSTRPGNLIGCWPLDEVSGSVAKDYSGRGHHGAITGTDLGQVGIGDGRTSQRFDGIGDFIDIYSASLASAFNASEGTMLAWIRMDSATWVDGVTRWGMMVRTNANNQARFYKLNTGILYFAHRASGADRIIAMPTNESDFMAVGGTWSYSNDCIKGYLQGRHIDRVGGLGVWVGGVLGAHIGASAAPGDFTKGWMAHCALWTAALTPAEMKCLGRMD